MLAPFIFLVILDNWAADMILCRKEDKSMCVFYAKIIFSESNIASHVVMCEGVIGYFRGN